MNHLDPIDYTAADFADTFDELPLWSAPFGMMLLERVPVTAGQTILDVGTGTGFVALELAQRCGAASRVIAVDPWESAIVRLRRKVERHGIRNVDVLQADAATLSLPDSSVDLVVSNLGVNNFDNPAAVLARCHRVAKPGATIVLTTNLVGHMVEFYDVYRATLIELGQRDRLPAFDAHVAHRGTVATVSELLRAAGFAVGETAVDSFRLRFADGSALLRHFFIRLGFVQGWKAVAAPDRIAETFAALERNLNAYAAKHGELALTIPMACITARRAGD